MPTDFARKLDNASDWWMVRGERGSLWPTLFQPRQVVAHGTLVAKFPIGADLETRERALGSLDAYGKREVNLFLDDMDTDHIIITPDAGSHAAWLGVVTSEPFSDHTIGHWMQRSCTWHPALIPLTPAAAAALNKGQLGTVFNMAAHAADLRESFKLAAAATP